MTFGSDGDTFWPGDNFILSNLVFEDADGTSNSVPTMKSYGIDIQKILYLKQSPYFTGWGIWLYQLLCDDG